MVAFGAFCDIFLSNRTKSVLRRLNEVEGLTTYAAVKHISEKEKLATSTVKYVLKKLKLAGLVDYNGQIGITQFGYGIVTQLGSVLGSRRPFCSRLTGLAKAPAEKKKPGNSGSNPGDPIRKEVRK